MYLVGMASNSSLEILKLASIGIATTKNIALDLMSSKVAKYS